MSELVMLSDVRLSFPNFIQPQKDTTNDGKVRVSYNAEFLMGPDHKGIKNFMEEVSKAAAEKWNEDSQSVLQMISQDRKLRCFGQGSEKVNKKTFKPYDGYEGMYYITAGCTSYFDANVDTSSAKRPQMIQSDGNVIDVNNTMAYQQIARTLYGGCRVNAAVRPWMQDNKHGRGVRCDLIAVQFLRDDTAFGEGTPDVTGMFNQVSKPVAEENKTDPGLPPFMTN